MTPCTVLACSTDLNMQKKQWKYSYLLRYVAVKLVAVVAVNLRYSAWFVARNSQRWYRNGIPQIPQRKSCGINPSRVYSATPNSSCAQHAIIAKSEKNCAQFRLLRTVIAVKKIPHYCDILKRNTAITQCGMMTNCVAVKIAAISGTHCEIKYTKEINSLNNLSPEP